MAVYQTEKILLLPFKLLFLLGNPSNPVDCVIDLLTDFLFSTQFRYDRAS